MKHLMTLLALVVAVTAGAQTFPWNPDSNNDQLIGYADFLDLLAVYGTEFTPENIICNSDSSSALIYTGDMIFPQCVKSCYDLGNNWSIPSRMELFRFELAELQDGPSWISSIGLEAFPLLPDWNLAHYVETGFSGTGNMSYWDTNSPNYHCYCFTEERPKVEYSYCEGTDIQSCADAKVADGWYPLGGISSATNPAASGTQEKQAFWRWAE